MIFAWFKRRRRRKLLATPPSTEWPGWLAEDFQLWRRLTDDEQRRALDIARVLIAEKSWEGAGGFELTERAQVLIAAQAALLLLGLEHDYYPNVQSVVVYPAGYVIPGGAADESGLVVDEGHRPVLGTAHRRGPVVLSWRSARQGGADGDDARNLVYHEFAHKLDMLDGVVDGTPPLPDDRSYRRWFEVMTAHYEKLQKADARGKRTLLDKYGATNVAEFFAVATETFFEKPEQLQRVSPELYEVLKMFYRQDPAAR